MKTKLLITLFILCLYTTIKGQTPTWQWAESVGGAGNNLGNSIALDPKVNSYITGRFDGLSNFGSYTITSAGGSDIFVAKYNKAGMCLWVKKEDLPTEVLMMMDLV